MHLLRLAFLHFGIIFLTGDRFFFIDSLTGRQPLVSLLPLLIIMVQTKKSVYNKSKKHMKGECIQTSTHSQIRTFDMGKQNTPQSGPRSRPLSRPYSTRASFQAWWANFFEHTQLHSSVTASTVHVTASAVSTGLTAQKSPFTIISLYIFGLPRPPQIILPLG